MADSFGPVEAGAEGIDLATNSLVVEVESLGALEALLIAPLMAAVVVGDSDQVREGKGRDVLTAELAVERGEGEGAVGPQG